MTAPGLTLAVAREVVLERAAAEGVELVLPDTPTGRVRRALVCRGVAMVGTWPLNEVQRGVSVTLPGSGGLADTLSVLGTGGDILAACVHAWGDGRCQVYPSPAAWEDAVECGASWDHEGAHARQLISAAQHPLGEVRWAIGYGVSLELRAGGAEGPAYTQTMAHRVVLGGWTPEAAAAAALESLAGYRLDEPSLTLARAQVEVCRRTLESGAAWGGPVLDTVRALARRGVVVPREWLP